MPIGRIHSTKMGGRTLRNPMRRSRKIGLTQGGRIRDGRVSEKWSRVFTRGVWEKLSMEGQHQDCRVFVENPSGDFYHPCQGHEYLSVLERLPTEIRRPVRAIILRRTPKLDVRLGIEARMRLCCVILNSFPRSNEMVWTAPPSQAVRRHYSTVGALGGLKGKRGSSFNGRVRKSAATTCSICFSTKSATSISLSFMTLAEGRGSRRTSRWNGRPDWGNCPGHVMGGN